MMIAHGLIWEHFIRERSRANSTNENDAIIVFEDDVFEARENAAELAVKAVENMKTDFLFLGHCCHYKLDEPPYCLHAYAMTLRGAKKMLPHLDHCGDPIDWQVR
jgi:DNA polymerase III epsilon subunit-like protein